MVRTDSTISIQNIGKDQTKYNDRELFVTSIKAKVNDRIIVFPTAVPHSSEVEQSKKTEEGLSSSLFQHVYIPRKKQPITEKAVQESIIQRHGELEKICPNAIGDIYFQFYPGYPPSTNELKASHEIQKKCNSNFISDYDVTAVTTTGTVDINKQANDLEHNICKLQENNSEYIVSPTIDMQYGTADLFSLKLDKILDNNFQRFNVIYASIVDQTDKWLELSKKLFEKNIWCNVVGVPQRYYSDKDMFSLITTTYLFGAHSASLGYPIIRTKKKSGKTTLTKKPRTIYNFNPNTHYYDPVTNMTEKVARIKSVNSLVLETKNIQESINNKTFYSKFVTKKSGLKKAVNLSTGMELDKF